ncbi:zinc finger protein ZAT6-like, partial [Dendrobium catenatum]|uniref:zinc finger protein ZAT6-like n=1 Tax=Dendrobium catenatum TaxID=906689 RepID=UPI0010A0A773
MTINDSSSRPQPTLEGWPKRKRSKRPTKEHYIALCLVKLAHSSSDHRLPLLPFSPSADGLSYKCSVCGKAFASYQALGGHKASHSKKPAGGVADDAASSSSGKIQHIIAIFIKLLLH